MDFFFLCKLQTASLDIAQYGFKENIFKQAMISLQGMAGESLFRINSYIVLFFQILHDYPLLLHAFTVVSIGHFFAFYVVIAPLVSYGK